MFRNIFERNHGDRYNFSSEYDTVVCTLAVVQHFE